MSSRAARLVVAVIAGAVFGFLSIVLAILPCHVLDALRDADSMSHGRWLPLAWYMGNALQGILASGLTVYGIFPLARLSRRAAPYAALGVTAVLAVFIPAYSITSGSYADGLVGAYALVVAATAAAAAWRLLTPTIRDTEGTAQGRGWPSV